jgi:hypothetical protein
VLVSDGDYAVAMYRYGKNRDIFVATWNKLYRTAFLRDNHILCIPHYLIDDPWFTYQVIICARSCHLLPDNTLFFTYNPKSVTSVKEQRGYTVALTEQYLGTERLKVAYIEKLTTQPFYMGALVDTMKMSLYHLYRACESQSMNKSEKEHFMHAFLLRKFSYPKYWNWLDINTYKALPMFAFYALPIRLKKMVMRCIVMLNLRKWLGYWWHF